MKLSGYLIVFGATFRRRFHEEVVSPTILDRSLRERAPLQLLINHDAQKPVASVEDGTLRLVVARATLPERRRNGREVLAAAEHLAALLDREVMTTTRVANAGYETSARCLPR